MINSFILKKWKYSVIFFLFPSISSYCQSSWPLSGAKDNIKVTIFKPVTEDLKDNNLSFRTAIALYEDNNTPIFGAIWGSARVENNASTKTVGIINTSVTDIRFPDGITEDRKSEMIEIIQETFNNNNLELSMNDISSDLKKADKEYQFASEINHNPPKIIYSKESSLLVTIDGEPIIESTSTNGIDAVVNTPFLILKYQNNFYLSNGQLWYKSSVATGNYLPEKKVPAVVSNMAKSLKSDDEGAIAEEKGNFYPKIIVSTVPAELIQTEGDPAFSAIEGTGLLYVSNTEEQILFDITNQSYYVLLSGRWYTSKGLDAGWVYISPEKLPTDFAKIPEGSDKDVVLASIPGTQASGEAMRDAQVPHAAVVSRSETTTEVTYDGEPVFETISGTNISLAVNSSSTVLLEGNTYFLVDNGIWFISSSPDGPWSVSDYRPQYVDDIPPSSSAYNVKYVYIYHSTPEVVYVGYTSGYLASYIVGRTIVYGTGYHYRSWRGRYYYPRPSTWGFGMYYNPWYGWSINISYGVGGFGWFGFYSPWRPPHWHRPPHIGWGWWGPPVYRPPYGAPYTHYYGHRTAINRPIRYGTGISVRRAAETKQIHNANIYNNNRRGVSPSRGNASSLSRPATQGSNYNYSNRARPADLSREMNNRQSLARPGNAGPSSNTGGNNATINRRPSNQSTNTGNNQHNTNRQPSTRPTNVERNQNNNRQSLSRPANTGNNNQNTNNRRVNTNTNNSTINRQSSTRSNNNRSSQTPQQQKGTRQNR